MCTAVATCNLQCIDSIFLCHFSQHDGDDDEEENGKESLPKMR